MGRKNIMDKIKASDAIFAFLKSLGVRHIFGVPGGGCMHLYNSAFNTQGLQLVPSFHEQASGLAAQSYAELSGGIAVCLVTAGPGLTNVVTAMAACWLESTPVLFIGGQAKTADSAKILGLRSLGQQEVDGVAIAKPITKMSVQITSGEHLMKCLPEAVNLAISGRKGPVFLEIPLDVQAIMLTGELEPYIDTSQIRNFEIASERAKIGMLVNSLKVCKKPAILIGAGVRSSGCQREVIDFCERYQIAMLFTWKALDLCPEDHPLNFGRPGGICQPYANDILQSCDLFISIGARNDLVSVAFDYSQYAMESNARYFIDVDANELKKYNLEKDCCIESDAADFIKHLNQSTGNYGFEVVNRTSWLQNCESLKRSKHILSYHSEVENFVCTYRLVDCLSSYVNDRHVLVPGSSGSCSDIFMQAFRVNSSLHIQNAPGLGSMGTCLPAITGAYLAFDGKRCVVSIVGDGGFQFNLQELQTIKNLDVDTVIFVLNNNGYASIRRSQKNHFGNNIHTDPDSGIKLSPIEDVAKLFKFNYVLLNSNEQVQSNMADLLKSDGQTLVEVMVHPDEDVRPRVGAKIIDGRLVSGNMRDYM
jgi:acetolactate synthase-1/2/3 large subunit